MKQLLQDVGGMTINNFAQNDGYDVHPERVTLTEVPRRQIRNAERRIIDDEMADWDLRCEECGRYLNIKGVGRR